MGRKYAKLFILDDQSKICDADIMRAHGARSADEEFERQLSQYRAFFHKEPCDEILPFYRQCAEHSSEYLHLQRFGSFWIFEDENLSFETIVSATRKISKSIPLPILYVSNFDDGFLLVGIYLHGKMQGKHAVGPELEAYGLKPRQLSGIQMEKLFHFTDKEVVNAFCVETDMFKAEDMLFKLLNVPLE